VSCLQAPRLQQSCPGQFRYNSTMAQDTAEHVVTFEVNPEVEGGFSAYARVGTHSMITQGDTLDELQRMILELVDDYNSHASDRITAFAMLFSPEPHAA
jgi:hypothetical protein